MKWVRKTEGKEKETVSLQKTIGLFKFCEKKIQCKFGKNRTASMLDQNANLRQKTCDKKKMQVWQRESVVLASKRICGKKV